jgi:hypothetical protein
MAYTTETQARDWSEWTLAHIFNAYDMITNLQQPSNTNIFGFFMC